jgi:hypothetical protein
MKINEIVNEGFLDNLKKQAATAKGYIQGGRAGAQAAAGQAQGKQDIEQFSSAVFQKWNQYTGQTNDTDVETWAKNFFHAPNISYSPADSSPASIKLFLTKVSQDYKAGRLVQQPASSSTAGATTGAPAQPKKPATQTSVPGFIVINKEPITIRYKGKDYGLNKKGEWVDIAARGTNVPPVNPTLEKLLDKAAGPEYQST